MLRQSTAPLALCVLFLASCNAASEDPLAPESVLPVGDAVTDPTPADPIQVDPVPTDPTSADPGGSDVDDPVDLALSMSPAPPSEAPKPRSSSSRPTLAMIYENMPWVRTLRAADGQGGFVKLSLGDDGNGDADAFDFDSETGVFRLREVQDFERPGDADRDNFYDLELIAVDYPGLPGIPFKIGFADQKEIFEDFPVVWLNGEIELGGLGLNVTSLGDIDSDGRPDLAVAAPGRHSRHRYTELPPSGYHPAGNAYLVSGKVLSETTYLNVSDMDQRGFGVIAGLSDDLNVGYNMILLGDLDGDELDDFVIQRDEHTIEIVSGATLLQHLNSGGDGSLSDLSSGSIVVSQTQVIDPTTFASFGDLNGDGLIDLAMCAHEIRSGSSIEAHVFAISGAALKDAMVTRSSASMTTLYSQQQAAYYAYSGNHRTCGPLTAIGDVNGDSLTDIAIPMPGPNAGDSGALVFGGAEMLEMMNAGGRQQVTSIDVRFRGATFPYTHFTDAGVTGTEQDYMVMPLGDVTGDGIDDFSFGWVSYINRQNESAFVVKGAVTLLDDSSETADIREMVDAGGAIQLAATPDNIAAGQARSEPVYALLAPEDGLHSTLIFVGADITSRDFLSSYSVTADQLPSGGTSIVPLPIAGAGQFAIPRGYSRLLSYVNSIGDLNNDGYGDLAIGWGTADGSGRAEDIGRLLLVSGKEIIEARARGETLEPSRMVRIPEE